MAGARPPDAAAARRFCALPRDLQGSAMRTREGPCGGCGRAAGSAGANGHGRVCRSARPSPRVRVVSVHDCRGVRRLRDGPALLHPTSSGRAFASFLCTIAAGVRRLRDGPALPHPTSHGRAFASFLCTAAAACAAEGRAGASPPHIPWPRVRSVPVHGRRGVRGGGTGRRFFTPHPMAARSRRSNSYRAQGGFAPTAAVRRRRAPLRSRSAPRAGRDPRGRSGRRPRSAGRWGGAGRASR